MKRVFVIGASGYIGKAVVKHLRQQQIEVAALSRTAEKEPPLIELGARVVRGDTEALEILAREASAADAVIYTAVNNPNEHSALKALIASLEDSGKPLLFTSGATIVAEATEGRYSTRQVGEDEDVTPPPGSVRLSSEKIVREAAARGIRSMVIRPPLVYGNAGSTQIPRYYNCGRKTGTVRYVGPGENCWAFVHVDDLAEMYSRLLTDGQRGHVYHAVAGEVLMGDLARAVARVLDVPADGWSVPEAEQWYGTWAAQVGLGGNCRPVGRVAEAHLHWRPGRTDILEDVISGSYARAWHTD